MKAARVLTVGVGAVALMVAGLHAPHAVAQGDPCQNAELRTGASADLPDCRALELVSPSQKVGGTGVGIWYQGPAAHGTVGYAGHDSTIERFAVQGQFGSVLTNGSFAFANDWALAERTPDGWRSHPAATRGGFGRQDYRFMNVTATSDDLSLIAWKSNSGLLRLFPELESWQDGTAGNPVFVSDWLQGRWDLFGPTDPVVQNDTLSDVLTASAISADGRYALASGRIRGLAGSGDPTHPNWPDFVAGSRNVYLLDLSAGLTDAFPAPGDGRRSLVNVCTSGTTIPDRLASGKLGVRACSPAGPGRNAALISSRGAEIVADGNSGAVERSISRDGSRVFFMSPSPVAGPIECAAATGAATNCPAQVYVRQRNPDGSVVTRWISRSRSTAAGDGAYSGDLIAGQDATLMREALFEGASRDGSRVFFSTQSPLTPDDPNGGCGGNPLPCTVGSPPNRESWDLYMYELPGGPDGNPATPDADPGDGKLTRISAGPAGSGDCNAPARGLWSSFGLGQGTAARFVAEDGGRVYFVCDVPLPDVAAPGNGTITSPAPSPVVGDLHTTANLYLYEHDSPLSDRWRFIANLPRAVAADDVDSCATTASFYGDFLHTKAGVGATVIVRALNCVRGTSDGSLVTFWTEGQLTGDDPNAGTADLYAFDATSDTLRRVSRPAAGAVGGSYVCADEPVTVCHGDGGMGDSNRESPLPKLGVASAAGGQAVFFQSKSRLVPEDTDDLYDVYQWRGGVVSLLSAWEGEHDVLYAGNDRAGRNVFVTTREKLTWQDTDGVLDVYSLRVGGGIAEPDSPILCDPLVGMCHEAAGAAPLGLQRATVAPGGGDAPADGRGRVTVRRPSEAQRRLAARRGVLVLSVRASKAGRVNARARARIGRRARLVGRASERLTGPGRVGLRLELSRAARRSLRANRRLRIVIAVEAPGALTHSMRVTLRRGAGL